MLDSLAKAKTDIQKVHAKHNPPLPPKAKAVNDHPPVISGKPLSDYEHWQARAAKQTSTYDWASKNVPANTNVNNAEQQYAIQEHLTAHAPKLTTEEKQQIRKILQPTYDSQKELEQNYIPIAETTAHRIFIQPLPDFILKDPGVIREYKEPNIAQKAKNWLEEQSILSPFAWATGHSAPPPSAAQDLAKPISYLIPNEIGLVKAVSEAALGLASGKPTTGNYIDLGLAALPYATKLYEITKITNAEGFLFKPIVTFKTPVDIKVGLYVSKNTSKYGSFEYSTFAPESFGKTEWFGRRMLQITSEFQEELGPWEHQIIPKGSEIQLGLVGPQPDMPLGTWLQIYAPNKVKYIAP